MTNDAFDIPRWSLDQALIWVATRNPDYVLSGESWMHFQLGTFVHVDDEGEPVPFIKLPSEAESELLRALQKGQIDGLNGTEKIEPTWFDDAKYLPNQDMTLFVNPRQRTPALVTVLTSGGQYIQPLNPNENKIPVRVPSSQILACFPAQDEGIPPQETEATVRRHAGSMKGGAKTRGIAEAASALFPGGIPSGLSVKERDRKIIEWMRTRQYSLPDVRTIRRFFNQ